MIRGQYGERSLPGHSALVAPRSSGYGEELHCSCGWEKQYINIKRNGCFDARTMRAWDGHLEVVQLPTDYIQLVGTVQRPRSTRNYYVFATTYKDIGDWTVGAKPWFRDRIRNNTLEQSWLSGVEIVTKNTLRAAVVNAHTTQEEAVAYCGKVIAKQGQEGHATTVASGHQLPSVLSVTPQSTSESLAATITMLDQALNEVTEGDLAQAQAMADHLERDLALLEIVDAKHKELKNVIHQRLVGVLDE